MTQSGPVAGPPPFETEDFLGGAAVYIVGILVSLGIGVGAIIVWSFVGLFVDYGMARRSADRRVVRDDVQQTRAWMDEHRETIERMHQQQPDDAAS